MQMIEDAAGVEVAVPFKIIKDGHGVEHKIVDFDKYPLPKTGQIVLEATKRSDRVVSHGYQHSVDRDRESDVLFGICTGVDSFTKNLRWLRLTLSTLNTFDLSVRSEREKAIVMLRSCIVEGSPNLSPVIKHHIFRVFDAEKAAHLEIQKITEGQRAISIASALMGEDLANMARNLGIMPEAFSHVMLTAAVLKAAQDKPFEFLALWDNPNRELITIFKRCLDTGVISYDSLAGYSYDGRPLGLNEPMVLDYFTKYRDIATSLDIKSREKLRQSEKAMAKAGPVRTNTDSDIENMSLKKQLAEMQDKLDSMSADSIRTEDPGLVEELAQYKAIAQQLRLKGLHNFKPTRESIDKLKVNIDKAKKVRIKETA